MHQGQKPSYNPALQTRRERDEQRVVPVSSEIYPPGKIARKQFVDDLEAVLKTGPGRRIFAKLFELSCLHEDNNMSNSRVYFVNGQKSVGNAFWKVIESDLLPLWAVVRRDIENDKALFHQILEKGYGGLEK